MLPEKMNRLAPLSLDSVVSLCDHQLSCEVANEMVVLEVSRGMYYGLNEVAAFVWQKIKNPIQVGAVRDAILAEFEVDAEECERDLLALLVDLQDNNLITVLR